MSSESVSQRLRRALPAPWLGGWLLDAVFTALTLWMIAGVALDFRAHAHGISFAEEGFFTPSHSAFYSAFVVIALTIAVATYRNHGPGVSWVEAIPDGYRLGVLGVVLFALGGPGDFLWHLTFGFEQGVEALTSPTHLLLAVGATLFLSSPLRAAWTRGASSLREQLPAMISAGLVFTLVAFFTLYQSPFTHPVGVEGSGENAGGHLLGVVWFSAVAAGMSLTLVRRFRLAPGAFTTLFALVGVLVTSVFGTFEFVPAVVLTGVAADGLHRATRPSPDRGAAFRAFGVAVPLVLFALYFLTVALGPGLAWSTHVWAGAVVSAGLVGLLVSYVACPYAGERSGTV